MTLGPRIVLAPLLLAQALYARARMPRLPEAEGPREGVAGTGRTLALWIIGDSSAAGVGVRTQDEALAGQLVAALAAQAAVRVRWRLFARSGVTTSQAIELVDAAAAGAVADIALVATGVNDVVDRVPPACAIAARERLVELLADRHAVRHVIFTPVPPMSRFTGLPQPLRWAAGRDAAAHERALAAWAAGRRGVSHLDLELPVYGPGLLARDGFHPAAPLCRRWGERLAAHIAGEILPRLSASSAERDQSVARPEVNGAESAADCPPRRSRRR